jgi:hypothetical protein
MVIRAVTPAAGNKPVRTVVIESNETVAHRDGDRVYVEQDNGAQLDFRASDLTAELPAGEDASGPKLKDRLTAAKSAARATPSRILTAHNITPQHVRVLAAIRVRSLPGRRGLG